jgi:tetratricopeptide (TPR) repeat protein
MATHALRELKGIDDPEDSAFDVNRLRGEALQQLGEHEAAIDAYTRALDEKPDDLSVLLGMAWCYKRTDQLQRAISAMEQAYRAAPNEPIVLYNLACYFALAGEKAQALSWLGRALRMRRELRQLIAEETDFDTLRGDPDFQFVANAHHVAGET